MSGPTDPAEAHFDKGLWGFDGTVWRKLPILWGYTDRYVQAKMTGDATAGTNYLIFTTVPAGEVWRITSMAWANTLSTCSEIWAGLYLDAEIYTFAVEATPAANVYHSIVCDIVLKAGDLVIVVFFGCTLGDDLFAWAFGYKMSVTS